MNSSVPPWLVLIDHGILSLLSVDHMRKERPTCFKLLRQLIRFVFALLFANAGRRTATAKAIVPNTIIKSRPVNPPVFGLAWFGFMRVFGLTPVF
jgi:hypothetical protein